MRRVFYKLIADLSRPTRHWYRDKVFVKHAKEEMRKLMDVLNNSHRGKTVFYLGLTEHSNLGDLAQCYCIQKWLNTYCKDYTICMFESSVVVDPRFSFV